MRIKTNIKAGTHGDCDDLGCGLNHNQTVKGLRVKSNIKAGGLYVNHNQVVKRIRVKSNVKAGGLFLNHNQTLAR